MGKLPPEHLEKLRILAEEENNSDEYKAAIKRLQRHLGPGSIVYEELEVGFVSNRSIMVAHAVNALEEAEKEIERLREYEWKYKDLCE